MSDFNSKTGLFYLSLFHLTEIIWRNELSRNICWSTVPGWNCYFCGACVEHCFTGKKHVLMLAPANTNTNPRTEEKKWEAAAVVLVKEQVFFPLLMRFARHNITCSVKSADVISFCTRPASHPCTPGCLWVWPHSSCILLFVGVTTLLLYSCCLWVWPHSSCIPVVCGCDHTACIPVVVCRCDYTPLGFQLFIGVTTLLVFLLFIGVTTLLVFLLLSDHILILILLLFVGVTTLCFDSCCL